MKHIINILLIISKYLIVIFFMLLGFIILPIAILFRKPLIPYNETSSPAEQFKFSWIDKIYGNRWDGFGDIYYRRDFPKDAYWSRLNWCLLRNPTHNLSEDLGVKNKFIVKSIITGNQYVTDDPFEINTGLKIQ